MAKRLYDDDVMRKSCQATVLSCEKSGNGWLVTLDQTVFFPEEGGQLSDRGTLGGAKVLHVSERGGELYHLCDAPLEAGSQVQAELDWQVRFDHMQQHTGEHILSYSIYKMCGANNVGFHMSEGLVTIDMDRELTDEQLAAAELDANRMIWENHPVLVHLVPDTELDNYPLRKKTEKVKGILRLVEVETGDICTCCGTHVPMTGMVGVIKVLRQARYKGGVRIEFQCGRWALEEMQARYRTVQEAGAELSSKPDGIVSGILRLKLEIAALQVQIHDRDAMLADSKAKELLASCAPDADGNRLILTAEPGWSQATAKELLSRLTREKNVTAGVFVVTSNRLQYLFASSGHGDCRELCRKANALFGGKGGGNEAAAQGSAVVGITDSWQEKISQLP